MKKVFIHIGAHKTGTTSLQYIFDTNRDLLKKENILYPAACKFQYAQHRLAFSLKNMHDPAKGEVPSFEEEIKKLNKEISSKLGDKDGVVILSSEEFFTLSEVAIERFIKELYNAFDCIEIIATLRRQDNQFISIYNQKVKTFSNGFYRHYTKYLDNPVQLDKELDYYPYLILWKKYLNNKGVIKIFVYEKEHNLTESIIKYITKKDLSFPDVRVNKSVPIVSLEFVRYLKSRLTDLNKIEKLGRKAYSFYQYDDSESLLSLSERKKVLFFFKKSNESIEKEFMMSLSFEAKEVEKEHALKTHRRINVGDVFNFFLNS